MQEETVTAEDVVEPVPRGKKARARKNEIPVITIRPARGWVPLDLGELWDYREIVYFLIWRDIKVRYKQTVLGALWAVLAPFFTMVVFTVIFGRLVGVPSDNIPYPIFSYSGLVIWGFFASGVTRSSASIVGEGNTIKKVYFPRLAIPFSAVTAGVVDFLLAFVVLIGMMFYYGVYPSWAIVTLPLFFLLAFITAMGVGLWFSALNVLFRDVGYIITFVVQIWLFATPIAYSSSLLVNKGIWNTIYGLNPMAGVVNGFRWALLGVEMTQWQIIFASAAVSIIVLISGAYFFKRMEKNFADVI